MFTGIITDIGFVLEVEEYQAGRRFKVATQYDVDTIAIGASICCSGICLTVIERGIDAGQAWFVVEAWQETLAVTTAPHWCVKDKINLERSLKIGDELGGHLVSGHVDGIATVLEKEGMGEAIRFAFSIEEKFLPFIAAKGSITLDGTSLTINKVKGSSFEVLIIRHTQDVTNWAEKEVGAYVNVEVDMIARQVVRFLECKNLVAL